MGEATARPTGQLEVRVEYDSGFLGTTVPIEVRDAGQRVVGTGTGRWREDLGAGLYSVSTMTADGSRRRELVEVTPGERRDVVLRAGPGPAAPTGGGVSDEAGAIRGEVPPAPLPPWLAGPSVPGPSARHVRVLGASGCAVVPDAEGWLCLPDPAPTEVPTVRFRVDAEDWLLSLPLNPTTRDPELSSCRVSVVRSGHGLRLTVTPAPGRRVTSFMDGVRRSRSAERAAPLVAEATQLLAGKYIDPAGATLGGLTLQRLGALAGLRGWAENLASGFPWIPDAAVLLAAVLAEDEAERDRAGDLLWRAARRRPLFTDGLSLALDLVRRWPVDAAGGPAERRAALEHLADLAAWADWDSVNLTTVTTDDG